MQAQAIQEIEVQAVLKLRHADATAMAWTELDRFLNLADSLSDEDWTRPTRCTRWNVRETVAHLAGSAAAYARFAEFRRQGSGKIQKPYRQQGFTKLDAQNQIQVDDRAAATPAELLAELRILAPRQIALRAKLPAAVRAVRLPLGLAFPEMGKVWVPLGYMSDVILTRDMWMHRLDISLATGRAMLLTREHDGRITALVVRDLQQSLGRTLDGAIRYELTGPAGGSYLIGRGEPAAAIRMDACDFHLLASRYASLDEIRPRIGVEGDVAVAGHVLAKTSVPY
jgi:uncharacterized protein (TIGR03083 family)